MSANVYAGTASAELPQLIVKRARRMHVAPDLIEDLQQVLVPRFATFQFDPARGGTATPQVVLANLIDRHIRAFVRREHRYQQRLRRYSGQAGGKLPPRTAPKPFIDPTRQTDMQLDVLTAMQRLSRRDRAICSALSSGLNVCRIAREIGASRGSVACAIKRIRRAFLAAGLVTWVKPDAVAE